MHGGEYARIFPLCQFFRIDPNGGGSLFGRLRSCLNPKPNPNPNAPLAAAAARKWRDGSKRNYGKEVPSTRLLDCHEGLMSGSGWRWNLNSEIASITYPGRWLFPCSTCDDMTWSDLIPCDASSLGDSGGLGVVIELTHRKLQYIRSSLLAAILPG